MRANLYVAAVAALLLCPVAGLGADPEPPARARNSACTGIYTGSARGVFWCKVLVVHDPKLNRTSFRVETEEDIQMTGDALAVTPGGFEWKGPPATGLLRSGDAAVATAWAWLQTGQPPNQVDYTAARAAPKYRVEQGELVLDLYSAEPGPKADGTQAFKVHGTFSARLLPTPGSKGTGEVQISVTF